VWIDYNGQEGRRKRARFGHLMRAKSVLPEEYFSRFERHHKHIWMVSEHKLSVLRRGKILKM
jgi:hypothetical protein